MKFFITGGADFIGSHMTDRLLALGHDAVVYDNFSTGHVQFLDDARQSPHLRYTHGHVFESGYDFR